MSIGSLFKKIFNFNSSSVDFLTKSQSSILSAAAILGISGGVNAILGLVKNNMLARYFGVSSDLTVFFTAEKIPNLTYSVLIVGAISTVFIPVFTGLIKKDKEEAFKTASSIISITVAFFLLIGTLIFFSAESIIKLLALNKFSLEEVALGASLLRIMLISQALLVISSMFTSVLQSYRNFFSSCVGSDFFITLVCLWE
jgi:putative peptidoglycan lipid II flippase